MEIYKPTHTAIAFSEEEIQIFHKAKKIFENVLDAMSKNDYHHFYYGDTVMTENDLINFIDNFYELTSDKEIYFDD